MANKTTGQKKIGRTSVKKLKGNPKELTAKEQKKVKGGLLSNIIKTKHETVKNSISNVR